MGSRGTRFVGSDVAPYAEGDLALIGPNLPHAWHSHDLADGAAEHRAVVCWFTESWIRSVLRVMPELGPISALLAEAEGGVLFGPAPQIRARILDLCDLPLAGRALRLTGILLDLSQQTDLRILGGLKRTSHHLRSYLV